MIQNPSFKGKLARDVLAIYEWFVGFSSPREEGVRHRITAFHLRRYQRDLITFLRSYITAPCVFFDVGANIGYVSREASRIVGSAGSVLAFEPNPSVFELLKRNCGRLKNATVHNLAVGDREATLSLQFQKDQTGEASLVSPANRIGAVSVDVRVVTLASYLATVEPSAKVVLKIDVEGFEVPVLRGIGTGRLPDCIIAEYNPKWQRAGGFSPREFYDWFFSNGYRINILGAGGRLASTNWEQFSDAVGLTPDNESFDCVAILGP